jgi:phosphoglycerate dehydrogenase-like enzyme
VDLKTLLSTCDIVCNTCKLTPQTRNMIGMKELKLMKSSAILTSTTGGIINLDELNEFLKENNLFGVGLDDVDQQQVPADLLKRDNVICTYHRAYDTNESEMNRIDLCIDSIEAFFKNEPINTI